VSLFSPPVLKQSRLPLSSEERGALALKPAFANEFKALHCIRYVLNKTGNNHQSKSDSPSGAKNSKQTNNHLA
jgi:hypothetical protein